MKYASAAAAVLLAASLAAPQAHAGPALDTLAQCLLSSATPDDKTALLQWMFASIAANPAVKPLSAITPAERDAVDKKAAAAMERLTLTVCRAQMIAAIKTEGNGALEAGIQVLVQASSQGLLTDPAVTGGLEAYEKYIDKTKLVALFKDAGVNLEGR